MTAVLKDDSLMQCVDAMKRQGLPSAFILDAVALARRDDAIYDLMLLWIKSDAEERVEIEADLQDHLDDDRELPPPGHGPLKKPKIAYKQLDKVVRDVMAFKQHLRDIVDRHGGVVKIAAKIGMPQSSLSRVLRSGSMPRRTTLYRIARALDIPETEVATEWLR
jgi:DNA-binding phage protein